MSREHETLSTIEDGPDSGGPIIPLVGKHTSCFTPEEDCFFDEGDALSRESSAFDPVDDATATRPFRARLLRRSLACRRWLLGCAVGAFLAVLTVTLVRAGVDGAGVVGEVAEARPPAMPARRPSTKPFGGVTERAPAPIGGRDSATPTRATSEEAAGSMAGSPFDACQEAYDRRHGKEVLTKCADAFVAEPRPEIAVMLAKTEFDSGRAAKALDWARKAITIDGGHAEAYVFLGAAEQATGRKAAAKRAYQHYLKLSPHGRHAADLRAVVGSL